MSMNTESIEEFQKNLSVGSKEKTNRLMSDILYILAGVFIVFLILNKLGIADLGGRIADYVTPPYIAFMIISATVPYFFSFKSHKATRHLMCCFVLSTAFMYFMQSRKFFFVMLLPIIVATRYYDKKFLRRVAAAQFVFFILAILLNYHLDEYSMMIHEHHLMLGSNGWHSAKDIFLYEFLTQFFAFQAVTLICGSITKNAKELHESIINKVIENTALETQLDGAAQIQSYVLENNFDLGIDTINAYANMLPAKDFSGDFYDFFVYDGKLYFIIADVADKGLPAAMFMMSSKNCLRMLIEAGKNVVEAITIANDLMCRHNTNNVFITVLTGYFDCSTGKGGYVNAGHPYALIKNKNNEIRELSEEPELFLGVFPDAEYTLHELQLDDGDTMFVYTDGLTDARNTQDVSFGTENVINALKRAGDNAEDVCKNILAEVDSFSSNSEQFDDETVLAISFHKNELVLPATEQSTEKIIDSLNEYLKEKGADPEKVNLVDVITDEMCSNIVLNAYPDGDGELSFNYSVVKNCVKLVITDSGIPFNPLEVNEPVFGDEPLIGGLGIYMTRNISDDIRYERTDGKNILTIMKKIY